MKGILLTLFFFCAMIVFSQDSVKVSGTGEPPKETSEEIFRATRIILGQSVETTPNGVLAFVISHHFGTLNSGFYNFFGLDQASTRIGLEYGIVDWLSVGVGRSTFDKTFDGYLKVRALRQQTGKHNMPLSLSLFGSMSLRTLKLTDPTAPNPFDARLSYSGELLVARKFGKLFSLQLTPGWVHKNLVKLRDDHHDIFMLGGGVSFRVSEVVSLHGEYYYLFPKQIYETHNNSMSLCCEIRTEGHVFQILLTNSQGNFDEAFLTQTNCNWLNGDIMLGFNIYRLFTVKYPKEKK
jgi:hypothetical protein